MEFDALEAHLTGVGWKHTQAARMIGRPVSTFNTWMRERDMPLDAFGQLAIKTNMPDETIARIVRDAARRKKK